MRLHASAHATSSATGSKLANIPTSGMIAVSFSPWQSQWAQTWLTILIWKCRAAVHQRPWRTRPSCSSARRWRNRCRYIRRQNCMHRCSGRSPHICCDRCPLCGFHQQHVAPCAQFSCTRRSPRKRFGRPAYPRNAMSIFPAREPQPMPIFLMAPLKPVLPCPQKWDSEMNILSIAGVPIWAS